MLLGSRIVTPVPLLRPDKHYQCTEYTTTTRFTACNAVQKGNVFSRIYQSFCPSTWDFPCDHTWTSSNLSTWDPHPTTVRLLIWGPRPTFWLQHCPQTCLNLFTWNPHPSNLLTWKPPPQTTLWLQHCPQRPVQTCSLETPTPKTCSLRNHFIYRKRYQPTPYRTVTRPYQ